MTIPILPGFRKKLPLFALLFLAALARAADWGGVSWGMTRAEVSALYPAATSEGDSRLKVTHAREILGLPFDASFEFDHDKLVALVLRSDNSFPATRNTSPDSFSDLLTGKYGAPLSLKVGPGSVTGLWRSDRSVIKLFMPSAPQPDYPVFSLYYWSRTAPRFDDI